MRKVVEEGSSEGKIALLNDTIKTRGISKIVAGKEKTYKLSDGKEIKKAVDVLQGKGCVVRIITFEHK